MKTNLILIEVHGNMIKLSWIFLIIGLLKLKQNYYNFNKQQNVDYTKDFCTFLLHDFTYFM